MFKDTRIGDFARKGASLTINEVEQEAYSDSVLTQMGDLNEKQLDEGTYSDGTSTPDYAPYTIELKKLEDKIWQHMTFDDTGRTRDSIKYSFSGGRLSVYMEDRFGLIQQYSQNIVGLTDKSIDFLKPEILENIIDFINELL